LHSSVSECGLSLSVEKKPDGSYPSLILDSSPRLDPQMLQSSSQITLEAEGRHDRQNWDDNSHLTGTAVGNPPIRESRYIGQEHPIEPLAPQNQRCAKTNHSIA
jgi:hypothetical protein